MLALIAASVLFVNPAPLAMPRASDTWLVESEGCRWLEDRYLPDDLWYSSSVVGCWVDDERRVFTLAEAKRLPPALTAESSTRLEFYRSAKAVSRKSDDDLLDVVLALAPFECVEEYSRPRQTPRAYREVRYYDGGLTNAIACAALPRDSDRWVLAFWELTAGDDREELRERFEAEFLYDAAWRAYVTETSPGPLPEGRAAERELLREDARHSVAAYSDWHFTDTPEFVILDDIRTDRSFLAAITNEFAALRGRFVAAVPSPLDGSNTLAVARIYSGREEFIAAVGEDRAWMAAYWSQLRRELVAYLPASGWLELRRTFRHEAFHQYLSYAGSMIQAAPWLNEGYAGYFEDEGDLEFGMTVTPEDWDRYEEMLPALMFMGYEDFYSGTDAERQLRYRLVRSIAVFIEIGAPKVRFEPFRGLTADYMAALVRTRDMHEATKELFGNPDRLRLFANEWKKFWKCR